MCPLGPFSLAQSHLFYFPWLRPFLQPGCFVLGLYVYTHEHNFLILLSVMCMYVYVRTYIIAFCTCMYLYILMHVFASSVSMPRQIHSKKINVQIKGGDAVLLIREN